MRRHLIYTLLAALAVLNITLVYISSNQEHTQQQFIQSPITVTKNTKRNSNRQQPSALLARKEKRHEKLRGKLQETLQAKPPTNSQPIIDYLLDNIIAENPKQDGEAQVDFTAVYFHAVERCASTTIKSLLLKYAIKANLTVYKTDKGIFVTPESSLSQEEIPQRIAGPETLRITSLREPLQLSASMYQYYGLVRCYWHPFFASFIESMAFRGTCRCGGMCESYSLHNPMSRRLGLTVTVQEDNEYEALEFIYSLERVFHIVMITEAMDESLVMLRDAMHWNNDHVVTFDKKVRVKSRKIQIHNETALLDYYKWNLADLLIYQYFKLKVQQKIDSEKTYYPSEAQNLRLAREETYQSCVQESVAVNQTTSSGATIENYDYKLKPFAAGVCKYYSGGMKTLWLSLEGT